MQGIRDEMSAGTDSGMTAVSAETTVSMGAGVAEAAFAATGANVDTLLLMQTTNMLRALEEDLGIDDAGSDDEDMPIAVTYAVLAMTALISQRRSSRLDVAFALRRRLRGGGSGIGRNLAVDGLPVEFNLLRAMGEARREENMDSDGESGSESEGDESGGDEDEEMGEDRFEEG